MKNSFASLVRVKGYTGFLVTSSFAKEGNKKKVFGKMKVEVDALNSYDIPVKLHYNPASSAVEDITTGNTDISKRLINGQLLIIRNGETYNANGALVK